MTLNANAVRVAGTGEVYLAPTATAAPADATTAPIAAWKGLGITSTDGVQFTMSRDTATIDGWQASKIRVVTNSESISVELTLMETTTTTIIAAFGGGSVAGTAPAMTYTPPVEGDNAIKSMLVDFSDGATKYRYYFPRVQVEGDVSFSLTRSDAVGYGITFGVLAATPNKWLMLTNDTVITVGTA